MLVVMIAYYYVVFNNYCIIGIHKHIEAKYTPMHTLWHTSFLWKEFIYDETFTRSNKPP